MRAVGIYPLCPRVYHTHLLRRFHARTMGFEASLASLFATCANTGMTAATNASLIVDDKNDVASLALNNVSP